MDRGTGLSERAVYDGLRKAVASGLIEEESDDSDRGRVKKSYSLKMRENRQADADVQHLQAGVQTLHPPLQDVHPDPQTLQARGARNAPRSEKDTQERHRDVSKFEGFHAPFGGTGNGAATAGPGGRHGRERPATGYASLREVIARRRAAGELPRRGRPVGRDEERERLRPFLEDFARELGDEAPLSSTITRALNIFQAAGVPPERWSDLLYQARGLTQERTAQIRKTATTGGEQLRRKNKMPYFLATLEQLVGLRPEPPRRERPG
jgi:hypothetical protein